MWRIYRWKSPFCQFFVWKKKSLQLNVIQTLLLLLFSQKIEWRLRKWPDFSQNELCFAIILLEIEVLTVFSTLIKISIFFILENKSVCNWYRIHLIIFSVKSTKYYIIAKVENTGYWCRSIIYNYTSWKCQ